MALPTSMKAITLPHGNSFSNPTTGSALLLSPTTPLPIPSPTQALIRIHAVAISPYELTWSATYTSSPPGIPRIPCFDFAGTVVTSPDSDFRAGDRVFGLAFLLKQGVLAEFAAVDTTLLTRIPDGVTDVGAASLPRAALTAWQAFFVEPQRKLGKDQTVLITGASGAVGKLAVQLARWTVGKYGKVVAQGGKGIEGLVELGADAVVGYRDERGWESVARAVCEAGFDFVLDCVGGETLEKCLGLVSNGGELITIGSTPVPDPWDLTGVKGTEEAKKRGVKANFFIVSENGEQLGEIAKLAQQGVLKPSVSLVVDGLTEDGVRDGWSRAEKGGLSGSVVIKVLEK